MPKRRRIRPRKTCYPCRALEEHSAFLLKRYTCALGHEIETARDPNGRLKLARPMPAGICPKPLTWPALEKLQQQRSKGRGAS